MSTAKQVDAPTIQQIDAAATVRLIMSRCSAGDEDLIRASLGRATVTSLPAVAKAFDAKESTVRNTWRRDGMPGSAKRGPGQRGRFVLADICIWLLKRADQADEGRRRSSSNGNVRTDAAREEFNAIELESARLGLELRRAKVAELTGDLISLSICRSEISSVFSMLRDDLLEIPRHIKPTLPPKMADRVVAEIDRIIRVDLARLSEQSQDRIIERVKESGKASAGE